MNNELKVTGLNEEKPLIVIEGNGFTKYSWKEQR